MTARSKDVLGLGLWVAACLGVSALGGWITRTSVADWYQGLVKPSFNPLDGVFTPVWIALFVLMGVAAWRVWRRGPGPSVRKALALFAVQLCLNLAWSALFFGVRSIGWALAEIAVLWIAIMATLRLFHRVDPIAGWLLLPYLAWSTFAVLLNASLWWLN